MTVTVLVVATMVVVFGATITALDLVEQHSGKDKRSITFDDYPDAPGDCLMWDQSNPTKGTKLDRRVPCDAPHIREVVGPITVRGPKHFPTTEQWQAMWRAPCADLTAKYLGHPVDEHGRFELQYVRPGIGGWAKGERVIWCTISAWQRDAALNHKRVAPVLRGRVGDRPDQARVYRVGDCIRWDTGRRTVPCASLHEYEVTGTAEIRPAGIPTPDADEQADLVNLVCRRRMAAYFDGDLPAGVGSTLIAIDPSSWDAGQRTATCITARFTATDVTPVTVPLRR